MKLSPKIRDSYILLGIAVCAGLILRITSIHFLGKDPVSDEMEYHRLAVSLVTHHSYSLNGVATAYRPPGYPFYLSVVYALFGETPVIGKLGQAFLDVLTCLWLFFLGRTISHNAGILAGVVWSIFLPAILYTTLLLAETLTIFLLVSAVLLFVKAPRDRISLHWVLLGFTTGFLILTRPLFLPLPFAIVLLWWWFKIRPVPLVAMAGAALLVVAPWVIRNSAVMGAAVISTNGGMNLYIGNHPGATGAYLGTFPEDLGGDSLSEVTRDSMAGARAVDYILRHPSTFLFNGVKKLAHLFRTEGDLLIGVFGTSTKPDLGTYKARYASLPILPVVAVNLFYCTTILAGIVGYALTRRDNLSGIVTILLLIILGIHFVYFGGGRFHAPLLPFSVLFAAEYFLDPRISRVRPSGVTTVVIAIAFALLLVLWSSEIYFVYSGNR